MLSWRRPLAGRELGWEQSLLQDLSIVQLSEGEFDKWTWLVSDDDVYYVNSSYSFFAGI